MAKLGIPKLDSIFNGSIIGTEKKIWAAEVTPRMAAELLERSVDVRNRNLSPHHVAYLRYLMTSGQWKFPAPALVVDESGRIFNGQHRLNAQIQANMTIKYVFMMGDEVTMLAFDNNKARTLNDRLKMRGYPDSNTLAATARVGAWIQLTGGAPKRMEDRPELKSPQFMVEYVDQYADHLLKSMKASLEHGYHANGVVTSSVAAAMHFSICRMDEEVVADKFLIDLHESDLAIWVTARRSIKAATRVKMRQRLRREDAVRILLRIYDRIATKSMNVDTIDPDTDYKPVLKSHYRKETV